MKHVINVAVAVALAATIPMSAQSSPPSNAAQGTPHLVQKDGRYALFVDEAPFLILGAQANNSSDWPATLPKVWLAIEYLQANTLEIPIYWEQFEPQQNKFDYTAMDAVLAQAREHHVHLVLLWFGTWKNGSQHYMPEWMKLEPERYFHVTRQDGDAVDSPSPFATASMSADIRAFTAFMQHLKAADAQHTVLMVQVENETGVYGTQRDHSAAAEKLFKSAVPENILKAMNKTPGSQGATWQDVFGDEADVCFHAWAVARYVGQVAAAGKAVYPLPLYTNAALRDPLKPAPGSYESGGPTDNVLPIWKAEAPALDLLAPDIYLPDSASYLKVLNQYHQPGNALFVPETFGSPAAARFFYSALGLQSIGYSPFGLDYTRSHDEFTGAPANGQENGFLEPTAQNYRVIGPMMRDIARLNFEGKLQAVAEMKDEVTQTLHFGEWDAVVSYGAVRNRPAIGNAEPVGRALVAQLKDNQFLVTGLSSRVDFHPRDMKKHRQFLRVEEGVYENGAFQFRRILNGDQTDWGLNFSSQPQVLRVSLALY